MHPEIKSFVDKIVCLKCGKIISQNYEQDRGHAETELYTHRCNAADLPEKEN